MMLAMSEVTLVITSVNIIFRQMVAKLSRIKNRSMHRFVAAVMAVKWQTVDHIDSVSSIPWNGGDSFCEQLITQTHAFVAPSRGDTGCSHSLTTLGRRLFIQDKH